MLEFYRFFVHPTPSNVWLGVSVENQKAADERIPLLLDTPAAVRFLSCEPLLGPLDLTAYLPSLDWVICGAESGQNARPMDLSWARDLRNQSVDSRVPFFMKQICNADGRKIPFAQWPNDMQVRANP